MPSSGMAFATPLAQLARGELVPGLLTLSAFQLVLVMVGQEMVSS